jgi:hypothetical protein
MTSSGFSRPRGGFERSMPPDGFDRLHRRVSEAEYAGVPWRAATFDVEGMFGDQSGLPTGRRWSGWACPVLPRESCAALVGRLPGAGFDRASEGSAFPGRNLAMATKPRTSTFHRRSSSEGNRSVSGRSGPVTGSGRRRHHLSERGATGTVEQAGNGCGRRRGFRSWSAHAPPVKYSMPDATRPPAHAEHSAHSSWPVTLLPGSGNTT